MASLLIVLVWVTGLAYLIYAALTGELHLLITSALLVGLSCYVIFGGSMNLVQYMGRVYWVIRDTGIKRTPVLSKAFMRMTDYPWFSGKGIQVRAWKYTLQFGWITSKGEAQSEEEGILGALDGRKMDETPEEIGEWK